MSHRKSSVTQALHYRAQTDGAHPAVTPLYQNSAFEADSQFFYTRKDNPNSAEFESVVALLEGSRHGIGVTTGMTAISILLALVPAGRTVVVNRHIYGCSFKLLQRLAERGRFRITILDLTDASNLDAIDEDCALVFFETPTNPFLYGISIEQVADAAKKRAPDAIIAVDNTWATSIYQQPLKLGADISLHSATKYFSGHSDVMGGVILADRDDLAEALRAERFYTGAILDPHSAWLLRRSMQTFALRMKEHERKTKEMVDFLRGLPQIEQVYYPTVDGQQLTGYGCIVFFRFAKAFGGGYEDFRSGLEIFQSGTGMAAVTSMVAQPYTGSHASMADDEKLAMGLDRDVVRLCFGLEPTEDLKRDISGALLSLRSPAITAPAGV